MKIPNKYFPEKIRRPIKFIYYFGRKYSCPMCENSFRALRPLGYENNAIKKYNIIGGGKRNGLCPYCKSTDRERLLHLYIADTKFLEKDDNLLHIAPERQLYNHLTKNNEIKYLTADIAKKRNIMECIDITDIQYNNDSFSKIICNHVLEHIQNDETAISELFRVLKPGGKAILQVPYSTTINGTIEKKGIVTDEDRELEYGQKDHVRVYSKKNYLSKLENAGFQVITFDWKEHEKFSKKNYGLINNEEIIIAKKPIK